MFDPLKMLQVGQVRGRSKRENVLAVRVQKRRKTDSSDIDSDSASENQASSLLKFKVATENKNRNPQLFKQAFNSFQLSVVQQATQQGSQIRAAMAAPIRPKTKFASSPAFEGSADEGLIEWLELYKSVERYNRWGNDEFHSKFELYVDGAARKWFLFIQNPGYWLHKQFHRGKKLIYRSSAINLIKATEKEN
jgi:hypothetical protein